MCWWAPGCTPRVALRGMCRESVAATSPPSACRADDRKAIVAAKEPHMSDHKLVQRAFTAILNHFVRFGRAPHYAELADVLDIGLEDARELQRAAAGAAPIAGYWLAQDTDFIESWAPFSNVPTHHQISVDGKPGWYGQ